MSSSSKTRKPTVRLHENLTLVEVESRARMEELELLAEFRVAVVKHLGPCTAVLDARRLPALLEELEKHGHLPGVIGPDEEI